MTGKRAGLSAMTLKYIAMATMLVDHMGYVLFPWILWLRCVGRIAFPIFAFQIAEGCIRTHDRRRYALRLLLFAVLTEVPFDLAFSGRPLDPSYQNVLWTLLAGALVCWAADWAQRTPDALHLLAATAAFAGAFWLLEVCHTDYGGWGMVAAESSRARAMPKSMTLTTPCSEIMMLPGLMSRWMMPMRCEYSSALSTPIITCSASRWLRAPFTLRMSRKVWPLTYSITRYGRCSVWPVSVATTSSPES